VINRLSSKLRAAKRRDGMRRVVLQMSVSVDGFVAGPQGGLGGSLPEGDDLIAWKLEQLYETGTHIMGRVTYEQMAAHWPSATDEYAAPMNELPKVAFSKTLERADWNDSRVARGDTADEIARLKQQPGKDIMAHGGAAFIQSLSNLGLIDEYRLVIEPVALGNGLPMFKDLAAPLRLNLVEAKTFSTGTAAHVYRPMRRA
jgi:dihydrofolate reductase